MPVCRIIGWFLLAGAVLAGGFEALRSFGEGTWLPYTIGEAWAQVHGPSLEGLGSLLESRGEADVWTTLVRRALELPLWVPLALIGLVMIAACRQRRRRGNLGLRRRF